MLADQREDFLWIDPAQENVHTRQGGDGPWIAPAIAMEHRQGPEVHRMVAYGPGHLVAQCAQVSAAMVVDHALGVAGGA
ncbi:hypothetical protein D9M71_614380 [compost metagenome]